MGALVSCVCGGASSAPKQDWASKAAMGASRRPQSNSNGYSNGYSAAAPEKEPEVKEEAPVVAEPVPQEPEAPPRPAPTTPITLETLQGAWVNSVGAKITVEGTEVSLNGIKMVMHPVNLNDDGTVRSIGSIWQLSRWLEDERIEFKEAPSREVMEFARSVVWSKATDERMVTWTAQMKGLGYVGSSKDPLNRSIEGCCPGTCDAKAKIVENSEDQDKAELLLLNSIIDKYRLPDLLNIPPSQVIPDFSNRGHTGLSVEHVHYLAQSFAENGFKNRTGNSGHDIPVLVQEPSNSELGAKSIQNWRAKVSEEKGFPPKEHYERLFTKSKIYTSLGNGHFNQALNLFLNECDSIYGKGKYQIGKDKALHQAVHVGVSSIVLRSEITLRERETVSRLLNSKREYKWIVGQDGSVNIADATEDQTTCKQFEALSKVLDAVELNCLVRAELGVKDSHRIGQ
eukprot:CAMPEP_0170597220 /NCGR_PEP_ID=MMETSP0224-20130122/15593_1 /TAXON_ID=285029 /ORGANISM="Togula jolla, Strain CCCM 725" /LENGTH=455 /DNA_ID=CAMNT_0010921681 /DNA_START=59 /DNA_END=1426 /DNA_ORIENTATION=-